MLAHCLELMKAGQNVFIPELENCQLCGSPLNDTCIHPGQSRHSLCYLITELNPFKQVEIKVKVCPSNTCSAMHQASVEKLGEIRNSGNCIHFEKKRA